MDHTGYGHNRSMSASGSSTTMDSRPAYLDSSALSPSEYNSYSKWVSTIKPSRSGKPDYMDEQDALRFLREECGIEVQDEIKILSLFERFPLGLLSGHFFALLRLASWVQRGEKPSKTILFTQAPPPKVGLKMTGPIQPPPARHVSTSPRRSSYNSPKAIAAAAASSKAVETHAESPNRTTSASAQTARVLSVSLSPPPVPDDSTKPSNPFRSNTHARGTSSNIQPSAILGFDPAPNPFKQSKPKLVRPTPIVADASTSVLGAPSMPAVDPFQSGASANGSSVKDSPVSGRSIVDGQEPSGPPLPPRPMEGLGADLRPPPPLPPRHISPLIQAGLNARSEVKKRKEALPPKTFTVLQSTSDRHPLRETPRLLTGQAAPPPSAHHMSKRKSNHGSEHRRSIVDLAGGSATSAAGGAHHVKSSGGAGVTVPTMSVEHPSPKNRVGPLPPTIAPKPSYVGKSKEGIPAWLREQDQLQRSSLLDHHNTGSHAPADRIGHSRSSSHAQTRLKKRTTSAAQRIEFLDNESDEEEDSVGGEDTLSEQAKSAASIDRNNPFFQHSRDANRRGVDLKETLSKLAVENAVAKAERDSKYRSTSDTSTAQGNSIGEPRPLGRSKTFRDGSRNGISSLGPPLVPPRRKAEIFPATLDSGTYPGFGKSARVEGPTVGGLRQTPVSKKADVGLPASVLAEREKMERERMENMEKMMTDVSNRSTPIPPPPRRRLSFSSQVSVTDSSATTPRSPHDETPPSSINAISKGGANIRERVSELLKGDLTTLSERHDWLARAAERAKGGPLNDARTGLMDDNGNDHDDAPEVDDDYLEEVRRQQRRQQRYSTIDMVGSNGISDNDDKDRTTPLGRNRPSVVPAQRRATDHIRRSLSNVNAAIIRRSSLLARSTSINHNNTVQADDLGSALDIDDDGVGPDVDYRSLNLPQVDSHRANVDPANEQNGWQQLP